MQLPVRSVGEGAIVAAFLLLAAMPLVDFLGRPLAGFHIPGSSTYTQQLTFYLTFFGGLLATCARRHLKLSTSAFFPEGRVRQAAELFADCVTAVVSAVLTYASVGVVLAEYQQGKRLSFGMPVWVSESVMPLALGLMAATYMWGDRGAGSGD